MVQAPDKSQKDIYSGTKKIKKTPSITRPQGNRQATAQRAKKYDTHSKEKRLIIIQSVMKALRLKITKTNFSPAILLGCLGKTRLDDLNPILARVLTKHVESFVEDSENLKKWRRKFREWVQSYNKPETRGGVLVTDDMLPEFKERVRQVLDDLPCRSFELLRPKIVSILEDMHNESSKKSATFNKKTACSKHFWYEFLEKNLDIKELYEELPIVKTRRSKNTDCAKNHRSTVEKLEEEDVDTVDCSDLHSEQEEISRSPVENEAFSTDQMKKEEDWDVFLGGSQESSKHDSYKFRKKMVETEDDERLGRLLRGLLTSR